MEEVEVKCTTFLPSFHDGQRCVEPVFRGPQKIGTSPASLRRLVRQSSYLSITIGKAKPPKAQKKPSAVPADIPDLDGSKEKDTMLADKNDPWID